jgi:Uma2 family endonuclease
MASTKLSYKPLRQNGYSSISFDGWQLRNVRPPMTDVEFEEFCAQNPNLHIEQDKHGNIIIMSPVSYDSGNYESEIGIDLGLWNRKTKLGKTFSPSTLFILPDGEKRMPDAAWVSLEKHRKLSKWQRKKFAHIVPDFIVEVQSPSDVLANLKSKITDVWLVNGVKLAWLIDVEGETVWVFRPGEEVEEVRGLDQVLSGGEVLPGFEFDLNVFREE